MEYKNFLIVASKLDKAGINITTQLSQFQTPESNFKFHLVENEMLYNENLDMEKINRYDFIIFASKHRSEKNRKTLTVHAPGNWRENDFGGEKGKVSMTSALFMKHIFKILNEKAKESYLDEKYEISMECTHHGPLINKPCLFIEIGSTTAEWEDRKAGFVIAKTIKDAIETFKVEPHREVAVALGGLHYCQSFNSIQLNSNVAIGHVIPSYSLPLTKEMVEEAIRKTAEEDIDFFLIDWKGIGNKEMREQVMSVLSELRINTERTSDINKR